MAHEFGKMELLFLCNLALVLLLPSIFLAVEKGGKFGGIWGLPVALFKIIRQISGNFLEHIFLDAGHLRNIF